MFPAEYIKKFNLNLKRPNCDHFLISPYNITAWSNIQVMRTKELKWSLKIQIKNVMMFKQILSTLNYYHKK